MALLDELADALAADVMAAMKEFDDDRLYMEVSKVIGTSSPSLQEAFNTSCRLRLSEQRARKFLDETIRARREGTKAPAAPRDTEGGH
ncbi:hypothetical protein OE699_05505 [Sedimentimonas flavescens]|uniref:Uncharacterized protein n=1 Tax=Sedimentimonas flavescens TaxID=2851012 RepID=A0ABT2ZXP7_9RHOB|nr:hypothetical protein [Sedimentimonas flavescens]MBW0159163.1 hypothetical protein [Sedimentimonas flavescens]MCT2538337.1 hypothetical protein [Sedimentimonas flavescens]MCV2878304.1 hypothetical protein [Sedimentimonas flavescens]